MRISDWSSDVCSSDLLTLGFTYNPASQIAQATRSNTAYSWTDAANGTDSYTTNGLNQYTAAAGASLGYDKRGNLTSSGTNGYAYSSENLLTSGPGSAPTAYDPPQIGRASSRGYGSQYV